MFRLLTAGEIECRVAQTGNSSKGAWCQILIYKDARVDQKLLDEVVGPMNWKDSYEFINGSLYCTVSLWDKEKMEWISKQNVGTESNTEKEKGQASDAFKRACFNWGLGRELYTAPKDVFIYLKEGEFYVKDGRVQVKVRFDVSEIGYDDQRQIIKLVIVDRNGEVRYSYDANKKAKKQKAEKKAETAQPAGPMTKEQFRERWTSGPDGGGITFDDIAECAKAWGLCSTPKTKDINAVRDMVLKAAGCSMPETFIGKKGEKLVEDSATWVKLAQRVARGETAKDGTPLPVMMADYYSIPNEAMTRFLSLVTKIQTQPA